MAYSLSFITSFSGSVVSHIPLLGIMPLVSRKVRKPKGEYRGEKNPSEASSIGICSENRLLSLLSRHYKTLAPLLSRLPRHLLKREKNRPLSKSLSRLGLSVDQVSYQSMPNPHLLSPGFRQTCGSSDFCRLYLLYSHLSTS